MRKFFVFYQNSSEVLSENGPFSYELHSFWNERVFCKFDLQNCSAKSPRSKLNSLCWLFDFLPRWGTGNFFGVFWINFRKGDLCVQILPFQICFETCMQSFGPIHPIVFEIKKLVKKSFFEKKSFPWKQQHPSFIKRWKISQRRKFRKRRFSTKMVFCVEKCWLHRFENLAAGTRNKSGKLKFEQKWAL